MIIIISSSSSSGGGGGGGGGSSSSSSWPGLPGAEGRFDGFRTQTYNIKTTNIIPTSNIL